MENVEEEEEEERQTVKTEKVKQLYHVHDLSVPVAFRKAPPHHVRHMEGFDSQQVEDHSVGEPELRMQDGWLTLNQIKRRESIHN